jgi:hypothetical protein
MTFMEAEARNKEPSIPIEKAQLRTAKGTEVSRSTVQGTEREGNRLDVAEGTSFSTPNKKKDVKHPKCQLDGFDQAVVRRTVLTSILLKIVLQLLKLFYRS